MLYIVGTPIGNLQDITLRALNVLKEVDVIACEDTRRTRKLLGRYDISKPLISYYQHNRKQREEQIIALLKQGMKVALVSDAGMPAISDPGYELVSRARLEGFAVVPVPGPSAIICALSVSGFESVPFSFYGFLPKKSTERRELLTRLASHECNLVFYETPHRILQSLDDIAACLGERNLVVARELTKKFEEVLTGSISEVRKRLEGRTLRGEFVVVIRPGKVADVLPSEAEVARLARLLTGAGLSVRDAARALTILKGIPHKQAYAAAVGES